jgi:quinone-modifying oxidoreductase subunit QmoA
MILVVGGGIAGITAAVELADMGLEVLLVEKSASLGGRVAELFQYFPKMCPPGCGLEMHYRRLRGRNNGITVLTQAEVVEVNGSAGAYQVTVKVQPRFVSDACTLCGACVQACPPKAAYLPNATAYPARFAIDRSKCAAGCEACVAACSYGAIDLSSQAEQRTYSISSIIVATGWKPYDASRIENLGFGRCRNVVTNVMLEKMAADGGRILRPFDGKEPRTVAFVQCAGSRDENHLPYCSAVCCSASLKQARYIRALYPETAITIFYIDIRTPGRLENFFAASLSDEHLRLVRGKVAKVEENPATGDLLVTAEDTLACKKSTMHFELVVLATGMVPQTEGLPVPLARDEFGFLNGIDGAAGIHAAGCVRRPADVSSCVQDATGAALQALAGEVKGAVHAS